MTTIPTLESVKRIEKIYSTGDHPVLTLCSDLNTYVCKYMRSSASAFKLANELIGSLAAKIWNIDNPDIVFVDIKTTHWGNIPFPHVINAPAIGSKFNNNAIDITSSTYKTLPVDPHLVVSLLEIALFDFWIANEDRNSNNANLLYDVKQKEIIPIDFGCIFNTASYNWELSQLTMTDTILNSQIFKHLASANKSKIKDNLLDIIHKKYYHFLLQFSCSIPEILNLIPSQWRIPTELITKKLNQLLKESWIKDSWNNFIENLSIALH